MVDRLEELLAMLEEEDDEDEREDAPGLKAAVPAAPGSKIETEDEREDRGADEAGLPAEEETALEKAGALSWTSAARAVPVEEQEEVPGADGAADGGAGEDGAVENEMAEFWWDELTAPVVGPNGSAVLRRPGAGDVELGEMAGAARQTGMAEMDAVMGSLTAGEKGLEGLYRQAVQAIRPAAVQSLPVGQAGSMTQAQEPGRTAALTVDELDRAVRRDSRRYDGGMTIF